MSADPADQIPVLMPMSAAARDVLRERHRQMMPLPEGEGFDARLDDGLLRHELMRAAIAYAIASVDPEDPLIRHWWPTRNWPLKVKDPRRNLVRAAALLIAEIERLDRAGPGRADPPPNKPPPEAA